jgi:hypothetical protein
MPDSITSLLNEYGVDSRKFWHQEARALIRAGYDPAHATLRLLMDKIGPGKPLGELTNQDLNKFGLKHERDLYPGVPTLFDDLRRKVKPFKNIDLEFYIISGGLQEIIEGNSILSKNVGKDHVYASQLDSGDASFLKYIKRCITFTEKTRYLFEINKGLSQRKTRNKPYEVNEDVELDDRRIPFSNMIYIGDGYTDIPCFSLITKGSRAFGGPGEAFGVFNPAERKSAKRALMTFLVPHRVMNMNAPEYRRNDALGSLLRVAVSTRCSDIKIKRRQAEKRH